MKRLLLAVVAVNSIAAQAVQLECYEDPRTNARQCIAPSLVFEKNGIRHSDLYTGGPNKNIKTNFSIHVNCGTNVLHIKDLAGVSFAGGSGSETKATRSLRDSICAAKVKKK